MQVGLAQCVNKGMQRDYSMDKASQEFAYENKNIRITTTGNNSFLSVTNEKSTINVTLSPSLPEGFNIIGSTTIDNTIILFGIAPTQDDPDYILAIDITNNQGSVKQLYNGNLNFGIHNPIECITSYEADDVKKVYWVDGVNQPRFINICNTYDKDYSFEFSPKIPQNIDVTITKVNDGNGNFVSGIIQYFITFYNKFEAETNISYESPLYYISPFNRGGEVNEKVTCSFNIKIKNKPDNFKYARVYSIIRTSLNAEPQAYIVKNVELHDDSTTIIDTNTFNTAISPTDLLFLGGNTIIASTIEQKDNTLFLGNIKEEVIDIVSDIKNIENKGTLSFGVKFISERDSINEYYPYSPNLNSSSEDIKTFKYLEWYKIGIQFQLYTGEWSSTVELGNIQNTVHPTFSREAGMAVYKTNEEDDFGIYLPALHFSPSQDLKTYLSNNKNILNWRLVMAEHSIESRTIKAQGLVLPTIFNLKERYNNTCYSAPLWTLNTLLYTNHLDNVDLDYNNNSKEIEDVKMYPYYHLPLSSYYWTGTTFSKLNTLIQDTNNYKYDSGDTYLKSIKVRIGSYDTPLSETFFVNLYLTYYHNGETKTHILLPYEKVDTLGAKKRQLKKISNFLTSMLWSDLWEETLNDSIKVSQLSNIDYNDTVFKKGEIPSGESLREDYGVKYDSSIDINLPDYVRDLLFDSNKELIDNYRNQYFLDANFCNFISPDINNVSNNLKFRIVGSTEIVNSISDYDVNVENSTLGTHTYSSIKYNVNTFKSSLSNSKSYFTGIKTLPIWPYKNKSYYINYWNSDGPITTDTIDNNITELFKIKNKKFANMWVCSDNTYVSSSHTVEYGNVYDLEKTSNDVVTVDSDIYKAEYKNSLVPNDFKVSFLGGDSADENEPSKNPIADSTPLEQLNKAMVDSMTRSDSFYEDVSKVGTTNINYKSSDSVVFKLPRRKDGCVNILPGYKPKHEGNKVLYSDIIYPIGATIVDEFFVFGNLTYDGSKKNINSTTVKITLSGSVNSGHVVISTDSDGTLFRWDYAGITNKAYTKAYNMDIQYDSFSDVVDTIKAGNTNYQNKTLLINIQGTTKYIMLKQLTMTTNASQGCVLTAEYSFFEDTPNVSLVFNDKPYSLNKMSSSNTFYFIKVDMFKTPTSFASLTKLLIGEFYSDYDESTFFGGNASSCTFIPISKSYSKDSSYGWGLEGDTYYQRWDHVRTYPSNTSDVNQNTDAVSVMLETYKNLDGDYRRFRGRLDTTTLTVENTNNVLNNIYSQSNNYKTSIVLDSKHEDESHPTMYIWSNTKIPLSDIDVWATINSSNSKKLDGDKGILTKIKRWNNSLVAFQEKGVALINFNQQTTISNSEGVPVEIANSGKVSGHYYISSTQGCKNKWSIVDSPYGLYFIDSYNKSINVFDSENIKDLSTINLFKDWIIDNEKGIIWNTITNEGFKSLYDPIHSEVYFINNKTALCYNELLSQFTSFYDYEKLNNLFAINGHIYGLKGNSIHKMFEGDNYCNLFGKDCSYSMTYKINKDPFVDKTWTNVEYKADIFEAGNINDNPIKTMQTFDTLEIWNEYQYGIQDLLNAKPKFRIWRTQIPRDRNEGRGLNRIRNPWIMLKLTKLNNTSDRMEFHDLVVKYLQ